MTGQRRDCQCPRARHRHGTRRMTQAHGCKCFPCRLASAESRRTNRRGQSWSEGYRIPRDGTRRRIEALHARGWSGAELARMLGVTFQAIHGLRTKAGDIAPATAERIADLYDRIWDKEPTGPHVAKTRKWAAQQGFRPPMAWDDDEIDEMEKFPVTQITDAMHKIRDHCFIDEIAVSEAVAGRRVRLTRAETTEAVATLTGMGYSGREIAERLGISERHAVRLRAAERAAMDGAA